MSRDKREEKESPKTKRECEREEEEEGGREEDAERGAFPFSRVTVIIDP